MRTGRYGEILTDEYQRTANPRIWAAGDVTGGPQFVYVAAAQGSRAAANAVQNAGRTVDYAALPRVTFTSPATASAGLTEAELIRQGVACDCRVLPLSAVPRAIVARMTVTDLADGTPIQVTARNGTWSWALAGTVVAAGRATDCDTGCGSYEVMCPNTAFHASAESARGATCGDWR